MRWSGGEPAADASDTAAHRADRAAHRAGSAERAIAPAPPIAAIPYGIARPDELGGSAAGRLSIACCSWSARTYAAWNAAICAAEREPMPGTARSVRGTRVEGRGRGQGRGQRRGRGWRQGSGWGTRASAAGSRRRRDEGVRLRWARPYRPHRRRPRQRRRLPPCRLAVMTVAAAAGAADGASARGGGAADGNRAVCADGGVPKVARRQ